MADIRSIFRVFGSDLVHKTQLSCSCSSLVDDQALHNVGEVGQHDLRLCPFDSDGGVTRGNIGLFYNLQSAKGLVDFSARYAHGAGDPSEVGVGLAGSPTEFRVRSAADAGDAMLLRLTGDYRLGGGWSVGGDLRGTISRNERSVARSATLKFNF